jgi:hypothetical protein
MTSTLNRRQHDRFALPPMYTALTVDRVSDLRVQSLPGHAYDLSEGGVKIELDVPLNLDERVTVHLDLPGGGTALGSVVHAAARVAWVEEDEAGPTRSALQFCHFLSEADKRRLGSFLGSGLALRAA